MGQGKCGQPTHTLVLKFVNLLILPVKGMTIAIIWRAEIKLENPKGQKKPTV